jgi:prolyl oligopeptidase
MLANVISAQTQSSAADVSANTESPLKYPTARKDSRVDDYHGEKVPDTYRWMEELDSPETKAWVKAEAELTDSYLEKIPARKALKERLTKLLNYEKFGIPFHAGERYLFTHNSGLQPQSVLYTAIGLKGKPVVAFSPNLLAPKGVAMAGYVASPDGELLAYGLSQGGSDWTDWHFRDLKSGKDLPDVLRWTKYYHPIFSPNGKGVYYSAFPAPAAGEELRVRDLNNAIYYHALGTEPSKDSKVYARPEHPDWQFAPHLTPGGHWLVITAGEGEVGDKGLENVYALEVSASAKEPSVIPLVEGFDAEYLYIGEDKGLLYFQTTLNAPRGRVIAIEPAQSMESRLQPANLGSKPVKAGTPYSNRWREVVPQSEDAMDSASGSVTLVDHKLLVGTLHDAHSKVTVYGLDGKRLFEVSLPGIGTASGFGGEPNDKETFYSFVDYTTPPTIYRLNLRSGESKLFRAPKPPFDSSLFETKQVFYPSKDGTMIPMYLVYRRGIKLDGSNPTLLYGYGGFGISVVPRFDSTRIAWLERGIFAVANLRGGGEYGEEWHRQAILANKQKVFDDFVAAAEWLISQKYTSTPKLGIEGGSNGGLLIGACVTQRPDLYGAALAYVGVMDMLRFDQFGQGAGWVGDYGSPQNPQDFKALRAYSPYHNVKPGTRYPPIMVITGDHDARVMPAHSFKFAAALQAAQAGPAPILLRVRLSTGHGAGPTTSQVIEEKADAYAFLMANLGMGDP